MSVFSFIISIICEVNDIATVTIEKFEDLAAARRAEAKAIKEEMPAFNVDFTPRDFQREADPSDRVSPVLFNFRRSLSELMESDPELVFGELLEVLSLGIEAKQVLETAMEGGK